MASNQLCGCGRWLVRRGRDGKLVCPGKHFYPKRDTQDMPEPTEEELDAGETTD